MADMIDLVAIPCGALGYGYPQRSLQARWGRSVPPPGRSTSKPSRPGVHSWCGRRRPKRQSTLLATELLVVTAISTGWLKSLEQCPSRLVSQRHNIPLSRVRSPAGPVVTNLCTVNRSKLS